MLRSGVAEVARLPPGAAAEVWRLPLHSNALRSSRPARPCPCAPEPCSRRIAMLRILAGMGLLTALTATLDAGEPARPVRGLPPRIEVPTRDAAGNLTVRQTRTEMVPVQKTV